MMSTLSNITEAPQGAPRQDTAMAKATSTPKSPSGRALPPLHPGAVIGGILDDIGVSVRTAAAALGVSHNALANLVRGTSGVSPDMAVRLGAYMRNGADGDEFWLRMQMSFDLWHARKRLGSEARKIKPAPRDIVDAAPTA